MAKSLYIIDGYSHIYAAYYAPMRQRLTSPAGEATKAVYIFTNTMLSLIENRNPEMLVVAMDSKAPTFRTKIYSQYKANRPPMPDDLPVQIERIKQILAAMKIPSVCVDGFEADDIIGTISERAAAAGYDTFICSKDKDMLQLVNRSVRICDLKTDRLTDAETMQTEMGISPQQFIDVLTLQGDKADNVPGVPDVGPKTALQWIQKYGSIDNLISNISRIKGKRADNLRNFQQKLGLSRKLVTIDCNVPLKIDFESFVLKSPDRKKLAGIFTELGFNRLLDKLELYPETHTPNGGIYAPQAAQKPAGPDSAETIEHDYRLIDTPEKFSSFLEQLKKQTLFAIDTETNSINPMKADLVGLSFCWKPHIAYYLPVKAPLGSKFLEAGMVRRKLSAILADGNVKKIGQNIKYDLLVLKNARMPLDGVYFDTMVASYCLDVQRRSHSMDSMAADFLNYRCIPISALIGKGKNQLTFDMVETSLACTYSAEDADITFRLYRYLDERLRQQPALKKLFEQVEMPLVSVLADMQYNGVCLDTSLLIRMSAEFTERLDRLRDRIYQLTGCVFNIDSPRQLAEVLFDELGLTSVRSGKTSRSTDSAVLEKLAGDHPVIELIMQYRTLGKLKNTYTDKLPARVNPATGRLHALFNQTITATGRLSSSRPNLQNIPVRSEIGRKIRSAFVPGEKANCILSADYSQIELRFLAHFSKDKALMEAFTADQDIHSFVASQIYNVPLDKVTAQMRSSCKAVNFGIIYGQTAYGLSRSIGISRTEAQRFIDDYFSRYSSIRSFMDETIQKVRQTGYAETILNRRRKITDLNSKNGSMRFQAERLAINTVIQGSAADLIKVAMINIQRKIDSRRLRVKLILQIHDELVFELPAGQVETHRKWIVDEMNGALKLDVPLKVDIAYGPSWMSDK